MSDAATQRQTGFTIIELLVVMLIIGIMAGIAVPRFRLSNSRKVELQADEIAQKLEMARTKALSTRKMVRLEFDVTGHSVTGRIDHDEDGTFTGAPEEANQFREFDSGELNAEIRFGRGNANPLIEDGSTDPVTIENDRLDFNVRGVPTPYGTLGAIYLVHRSDPDAVAAIWVASSGAFRVVRWRDGQWR